MSKLLIVVLCLGVLAAIAMATAALWIGYQTMMVVGFVALVVVCAFGWLLSWFS